MKEHQDNLRYPIGQFEYGKSYSLDDTRKHIKILSKFPKELKSAVKKLKSGELEKTYRPEGWTVRQVINHIADSHINAYTRLKLAVTENTPIIKPYEENLWAELEDGKHGSVKTSLKLISALHNRWVHFLKSLQEDDLEKGYYHPASKRTVLLQEAIALYVWHSQHHLAHIMLVVNGKSKSVIGKKSESKTEASDDKPKSAAPAKAPKKRVITDEHREKIRAAQVARHAKKAESTQESAAPAAPKRGRKPGVKAAAVKAAPAATDAAAPKRGRKPGVKAAAVKAAPAATDAAAPKRGRKPGVKAAAVKAAPAATDAAAPKRGRKPGVKAVAAAAADVATKRKRRTKAEMEAARTGTVVVAAKPAKAPKAPKAVKAAATNPDGTPKKRGLSPERMAEIRALRGAKKTTEAAEKPAKAPKAVKAAKVAKAAKAPALNADGTPKKRGLSPERMAEIRALRGAKKATEAPAEAPKAVKAAKVAKVAKAAKAPALNADGTPKKRGLSPEKMAEIRAMKKKK
ncbi:MAG: putative metal-dependent hydrolase [Saprospiraceae bacterium]|nr:putative metal-dependent hydrolase [Saprospiraceae bacterium]